MEWMQQQQPALDQQQGGAAGGDPDLARMAYSRAPRPVDYQPYTFKEYQERNYDPKSAPAYWQLGRLGPGERACHRAATAATQLPAARAPCGRLPCCSPPPAWPGCGAGLP
jgi:hypothetical protein